MAPFAHYLKELRKRRQLRQKEAAELLGYEQSYLSALETGAKGLPRQEFINRLKVAFALTPEETAELDDIVDASRATISIPKSARDFEYWLCHELERQLGSLTGNQAAQIWLVLTQHQPQKLLHSSGMVTQMLSDTSQRSPDM